MSNTTPPDASGDSAFVRDGAFERERAEQLLVASAGQGSHGLRFLKTRLLAAARREARLRSDQRKARLVSSTLLLMVGVLFLGAIVDRLPEAPPAPAVAAVVREARQPWATKVVPGESHEPFPGDGSEWTLAHTNYDPVERLRERWEELV
jgi:hypothetical protein